MVLKVLVGLACVAVIAVSAFWLMDRFEVDPAVAAEQARLDQRAEDCAYDKERIAALPEVDALDQILLDACEGI